MAHFDSNPQLEWRHIQYTDCLYFTFQEQLTAADAAQAIALWKAQIATVGPDESVIHIWDCTSMRGYDPESRTLWQDAIKQLKPRIKSIWLISSNIMIRQGARIVSLFAGIEIHAVSTAEDLRL